jgi:molecular chaperone DnaK (HSP70)
MGYALGIDLGTTYTAAAMVRDGRPWMADLGSRGTTAPSAVLLEDNGEIVVGEAAMRRSVDEPSRVAREFKRRIGDPEPILLAGSPFSAEALMGCLLRWTVRSATEHAGGRPARVAVTHPAHWGPYKLDLLTQAVRLAEVKVDLYLTEAEAVAMSLAHLEGVAAGTAIAVYDLGGATFDACVLRRTALGFDMLGGPGGIDRLGGVDFDQAMLAHVDRALGGAVAALDPNDPAAFVALERLRQACVNGKEALSTDDRTSVRVNLPNVQTELQVTRSQLEALLLPSLAESVVVLRRALRSAGLARADVDVVLLVGGSSHIPLVAQLVGKEFGRPISVNAHLKAAVALGAALAAGHTS